MRLPLALFAVLALFAAATTDAGVPPSCPPASAINTFVLYNGLASNCTQQGSGACSSGETIAFTVGTFAYNLYCTSHTFTWNFGDGGSSTALSTTHTYANPGTYNVSMTMTDPQAGNVIVTTQVQVAAQVPATSTATLMLLALALGFIALRNLTSSPGI